MLFPLRDDNPSPRFPFIVLAIIGLNVWAFWQQFQLSAEATEIFVNTYALVPARDFAAGAGGGSILAWLAPYMMSMFLHGGFFHILLNMGLFWIFGDNVEGRMGPVRFLFFYLACGLAASLAHCFLYPDSTVPVVGASGAISGVMGAYLFLFPRARLHMFTLIIFYPLVFQMPSWVFLVFWFMGQLLSGTADLTAAALAGTSDVGGVAFFAHIGGFVAGILLLPFFRGPRPKVKRAW